MWSSDTTMVAEQGTSSVSHGVKTRKSGRCGQYHNCDESMMMSSVQLDAALLETALMFCVGRRVGGAAAGNCGMT